MSPSEVILPRLRSWLLTQLGLAATSERVVLAQRGPQAGAFPRPPCLVLNLADQGETLGTPARLALDGQAVTLVGRRGLLEITAYGFEAQGWLAQLGPALELARLEGFVVVSAGRLVDISALTGTGYEPTTLAEFEVYYQQAHASPLTAATNITLINPDAPVSVTQPPASPP